MSNNELKMNPLDPKVLARIQEEWTDERNRQDAIKKDKAKRMRKLTYDADPRLMAARIDSLEHQLVSIQKVLEMHSNITDRLITLMENR